MTLDDRIKISVNMLKAFMDKGISYNTMGAITGYLIGLPVEEAIKAEQLLSELTYRSENEKDLLQKAINSFGRNLMPEAVKLLETMD